MQSKKSDKKSKATERKRVTIWDFVLMAVFVCAAVFVIFIQHRSSDEQLEVVVKKDSEIVYTQSLTSVSRETEVPIDDEYNIILSLMPDGVAVSSSDCGDKVCVNTGKITRSGQAIVCLPAHISVELQGGEPEADVIVG